LQAPEPRRPARKLRLDGAPLSSQGETEEEALASIHATPVQLIKESAPGLLPLARRVDIRDRRGSEAGAELLACYREVTDRVRATQEAIVTGHAPT
jgi:hypothetical protein